MIIVYICSGLVCKINFYISIYLFCLFFRLRIITGKYVTSEIEREVCLLYRIFGCVSRRDIYKLS